MVRGKKREDINKKSQAVSVTMSGGVTEIKVRLFRPLSNSGHTGDRKQKAGFLKKKQ